MLPIPPFLPIYTLSLAVAQADIPQGGSGLCPIPRHLQATHPCNGRFPAGRILGRTAKWAEAETLVSSDLISVPSWSQMLLSP